MSVPQASLSVHFPWTMVLPLLDIPTRVAATPLRVTCACCGGDSMTIYDDDLMGGCWYYCTRCGFAGDSIDLVAKAKGLPIQEAFGFLIGHGLQVPPERATRDVVRLHEVCHVDKRKKVLDFWRAGVRPAESHHSDKFDDLLTRLGLSWHMLEGTDWPSRGGRLVGFTDRKEIEGLLRPGTVAGARSRGSVRLFRGDGWGPLLMVPFWDMPGRIHGFMVIGRKGDPSDFVYIGATSAIRGDAFPRVSMLPIVEEHPGSTLVVTRDVGTALRMQLSRLAASAAPLPLVAMYGRTPVEWLPSMAAKIVHWDPSDPLGAVRLARMASAKVCTSVKPATSNPQYVVNSVVAAAESWASAAERHAARASDKEAAAFVAALGMTNDELGHFVSECTSTVRAKLEPLLNDFGRGCTVGVAGSTVREEPNGWYIVRKRKEDRSRFLQEMVCSAPIRVDRVTYLPRSKDVRYEGRVLLGGVEVPYAAPGKAFLKDPMGWLNRHLISQGLGVLTYQNAWSQHTLLLAHQFGGEPAHGRAVESVGWVKDGGGFSFPSFSLTSEGAGPAMGSSLGDLVPCRHFEPPAGLTSSELDFAAGDDRASSVFLAVMLHVAAEAIAPCVGSQHHGLAFVGRPAARLGRIAAEAAGCVEVQPSRDPKLVDGTVEALLRASEENPWPVAFSRDGLQGEAPLPASILSRLPPCCMVASSELDALVLESNGPWRVLRFNDEAAYQAIRRHGKTFMANYLARFCRRWSSGSFPDGETLFHSVAEDVRGWFESSGRHEGDPVGAATKLMTTPTLGRFGHAFTAIVSAAYSSSAGLEVFRDGVDGDEPPAQMPATDGTGWLFIPSYGLNGRLADLGSSPLDLQRVTRRLSEAGMLLGTTPYHGMPGWRIDQARWAVLYREHRREVEPGRQIWTRRRSAQP